MANGRSIKHSNQEIRLGRISKKGCDQLQRRLKLQQREDGPFHGIERLAGGEYKFDVEVPYSRMNPFKVGGDNITRDRPRTNEASM